MYAAAKRVRVPSKLSKLSKLQRAFGDEHSSSARCFRSFARLEAKATPQPRRSSASPVFKSPFRHLTPCPVRNAPHNRYTGTPRYILAPAVAPPQRPHAAITVLPPPSGMLSYVQIVSTPTADTPGACLMLHFDNRRYLFGRMAEGTQRNMVQRKVSLAKIHDIFLTGRVDWETAGGLLGMILTIADLKAASIADVEALNEKLRSQGKKDNKSVSAHLNIHGGKNLVHLLATARRFILRKALPVHPRELRHDPRADTAKKDEPDYEDENIRVWSIPLSKEGREEEEEEEKKKKPAVRARSGPSSPKKRKLSESSSSEPQEQEEGPTNTEEADQNIREAVVKDMFASKWKLDTLRELRLADVQLPAKIFIRNEQGHIEPYEGPPPSEAPDTKVLVRLPWPAAQIEQLPPTEPSRQSMCYVVKCHSRRGKFNVQAATKLGVAKQDFKKLTSGETVTGKDGVVVTPDMVLGPPIEGQGFAVVDLPSEDLVEDLLSRPEWSNPEIMKGVSAMFWILSSGVTLEKDQRLAQFVRARSGIRHIVLSSSLCPNVPALESPAGQLIKMNCVDRDRFPLPAFDFNPTATLGEELQAVAEVGRPGLKFQLAPKSTFLTDAVVPPMDTKKPLWELGSYSPQVPGLADAARKAISDPAFGAEVDRSQQDLPSPQTEIIPLGTGSAMPSKYRNVSATLIRVPGWGSYLLDCGENTLGQLRRALGHQGADEVLRDLRAIYISHVHADHHLGTVSVIARWREVVPEEEGGKLALIATQKYQDFVREFHEVQDLGLDRIVPVVLRCAGRPLPGRHAEPPAVPDEDARAARLPRVEACFVDHCYEATAAVLTFPDTGLKVAYSGDCRPSRPFAELARGAHLLVHECTFEDELAGDAAAKKHSTLSEALEVGRRMEARRILLTHFSQRYPKLPVVDEEALLRNSTDGGDGGNNGGSSGGQKKRDVEVLFAFDMMRVRLGEFKQAKQFLPALRELLKVEERMGGGDDGGDV
ncbi:hypothetical protein MYCTH_2305317 [Thermothelomyces thermophilus ATCC 42464]|uniref:ribonuclease Z n=1 Tax=Thermothelomyces thermophilus (strain ATCC 42464 / BCRC 31852 / DSM 1799) TaxID=573729 RepID=G2QCH3_THET4|nr:uncharacterized protein MYCTH_2305317 [Thermothelomyces thermophilus ATCC 42464]AEO58149.1 hypothetical protein MYCTH_2305317 [Thermothelomyces thermophilus ATCC 42464]